MYGGPGKQLFILVRNHLNQWTVSGHIKEESPEHSLWWMDFIYIPGFLEVYSGSLILLLIVAR